jgi:signal transduction histidine kinase
VNPWPYQLACALLSLASLWLNRSGKFSIAKILLGLSVNLTVFIFASSEPMEVGLYMYFIIINTGALVGFGYEERGKAIFFVLLSTGLFLIALFFPFTFIERSTYSLNYILINIVLNFIGASFASAAMIYFLININHRSEAQLRKNEEELSLKNQELIKLNAELDRFASNTSHDLKAPLNSILGLVQLMDLSNDVSEIREYSKMVKTRVSDLNTFIKEVTDYSRNASSQLAISKLSVRKLVRDALERLRYFPGANRITIHLDIEDTLEISTDTTRLQIVLNNLLSNAFKYQDKNKENQFVRVTAKEQRETITISVEDNGLGIPAQQLGKIFDMYARANDQVEGTGLGLYIVKETIEKLGGTISVISKEGKGTTFYILLPHGMI